MSGRTQALMRTRCPACTTVFRVTSEQLRLKAGKVRCGHCQSVFNAFDQLVPEEPPAVITEAPAPFAGTTIELAALAAGERTPGEAHRPEVDALAAIPDTVPSVEAASASASASEPEPEPEPSAWAETLPPAAVGRAFAMLEPLPVPETVVPAAAELAAEAEPAETIVEAGGETADESPEQSTQAAREAGLVAAREWAEAPAYNRWAAGTLAGEAPGFSAEAGRRALWPFVIAVLLLGLILAAQLLYHFRTEVVRWLPSAAAYYELLGVAVPLPRQAELVAIESSDLQSDNLRGQFVLQATLRNRASYAQDWPALELTLTDAGDTVVARRVMSATEYLPPAISPERFPANGEVAVRLWIEARDLGAAGYRLYVFYP